MDDTVRDRITGDVVEVSEAVGGGDLYVRYDDEIHFGSIDQRSPEPATVSAVIERIERERR